MILTELVCRSTKGKVMNRNVATKGEKMLEEEGMDAKANKFKRYEMKV